MHTGEIFNKSSFNSRQSERKVKEIKFQLRERPEVLGVNGKYPQHFYN